LSSELGFTNQEDRYTFQLSVCLALLAPPRLRLPFSHYQSSLFFQSALYLCTVVWVSAAIFDRAWAIRQATSRFYMGEHRLHVSENISEERTEPFSQSEIDARLRSIRVVEPADPSAASQDAVPLHKLQVEDHHRKQGIRILVRPLTRSRSVSPGNDNCQWLALRAEVASQEQPQHKVLAVTQTSKDIKFSVRIPGETLDVDLARPPLWCELYYDPASDNQILLNRSDVPISLAPVQGDHTAGSGAKYAVNPGTPKALSPGTWRITVHDTPVLDFRILEKRPATLRPPQPAVVEDVTSLTSSDIINSSGKRSLAAEDSTTRGEKKARTGDDEAERGDGVIMFLRPAAEPLVFPLPTAAKAGAVTITNGHPLLDMQKDDTVAIPGSCEIDEYQVTKRDQIASTVLSSVFTAEHSNVPDGIVTVKVLKTRVLNPNVKPQESERNVIRQADMWLREYQSQDDLKHDSIVRLYGGDARFLSLYMEHVDARDLSVKGMWRNHANDHFLGTRSDAICILRDISGALHYIHERNLVHNDIKPGNILYSPERGAVLCDFGLSTHASNPPTTGGTPYYVPPEFIGQKLRGAPSDVWALGITMLYILRKMPLPDSRARQAHPRQLYWIIADLNRVSHHRPANNKPSAVDQMRTWLNEIAFSRGNLNSRDRLERLISDMLAPNPSQRVTMAKIRQEMLTEQFAIAR
jgi:serine/threonine protein kinase